MKVDHHTYGDGTQTYVLTTHPADLFEVKRAVLALLPGQGRSCSYGYDGPEVLRFSISLKDAVNPEEMSTLFLLILLEASLVRV